METDNIEHGTLEDTYENLVRYAVTFATESFPVSDLRQFPIMFADVETNQWIRFPRSSPSLRDSMLVYLQSSNSIIEFMQEGIETLLGRALEKGIHFHGTSWDFAMNMVDHGVSLQMGESKTDFGPNCLYLSEDFSMAAKWALRKYWGNAAVVIFSREWRDEVAEENTKRFEVEGDEEWQTTVFKFRSAFSRDFQLSMRRYHIMEGLISRQVTDIVSPASVEPVVRDDGVVPIQVAARFEYLQEGLDTYLVGVVFFASDCRPSMF